MNARRRAQARTRAPDPSAGTRLLDLARRGDAASLRQALRAIPVSQASLTALLTAAVQRAGSSGRRGDPQAVVQLLLQAGARPDWPLLCEALRGGHQAIAAALAAAGIRPNLFTLAARADLAGVRRRLRRAPEEARQTASMEPGCRDVTPLHVGCASALGAARPEQATAQVNVARVLVQHGADVQARGRYRNLDEATPLFCACWSSENPALVRWLLEQGAPATVRDLLAALGHFQRHGRGSYDMADALVAWGVAVDGPPGERPPLQAFAHQGSRPAVAWLLAHGADIHARGPGSRTAAHCAAERNTGPATLALLVAHGADLRAVDADGRTPLDLAVLHGKHRLVAWIRRHLA